MSWALIILVVSMGASGGNAITQVAGFKTKATCEAAGEQAKLLSAEIFGRIVTRCLELK
jgi:hypothetical protein